VTGEGVSEVASQVKRKKATVTVDKLVDGAIIVLPNEESQRDAYQKAYEALLARE
jgi:hypothetical protein